MSSIHFLYADESNLRVQDGNYFVYAGIGIPGDSARGLHEDVARIRAEHGVPVEYVAKFNPGPETFSHDQFVQLKAALMQASIDRGVRLFSYFILHDIARGQGVDASRRYGVNTLLFHFDCYLHWGHVDSAGIVLLDRFQDSEIDGLVRERLARGITDFEGDHPLERILGVHYSAIGQSCFASLADIMVGSLRFALNAHTGSQNDPRGSGPVLLRQLAQLIPVDHGTMDPDVFAALRPRQIRYDHYRDKYRLLCEHLVDCGFPSRLSLQYR